MEGHTDSKPYAGSGAYSNWELSSDRANAARRLVQANGIRPDQVTQVRGFADQRLRKPEDPLDPSNRRISLIVQYVVKDVLRTMPRERKTRERRKKAKKVKKRKNLLLRLKRRSQKETCGCRCPEKPAKKE